MIERVIIAILLLLAGFAAYQLLTRWQIKRAADQTSYDPLLVNLAPGIPAIVYFTTPTCAPCRLQQTPNLLRLEDEMGSQVQIIRVDASQNPEAADRWGVFSVPTTFVLDKHGIPHSVHNGVVGTEQLKRELQV